MFIHWKSLPDWHRFEIDGINKRKVIKFSSWIDIFLNRDVEFRSTHLNISSLVDGSLPFSVQLYLTSSIYQALLMTSPHVKLIDIVLISIFTHQSVGTSCFHWKCQLYIGYLICSFLWWVMMIFPLCEIFPVCSVNNFWEIFLALVIAIISFYWYCYTYFT